VRRLSNARKTFRQFLFSAGRGEKKPRSGSLTDDNRIKQQEEAATKASDNFF
jgi:hypothetical protein